ncbi:MAG: RNA-binding S4 domain-containing protein [Anaerolineae bacterium]
MDEQKPTIRLDQFMKLTNMVMSGGEAKHVIQAGEVRVNSEVDTRRSHKLHPGDRVEFAGRCEVVTNLED